jgi:hypothetical protein
MDTVFTTHNYVGVSAKPLFVTDVSVVKATPYVFRGFALALHSRLLSFFLFFILYRVSQKWRPIS